MNKHVNEKVNTYMSQVLREEKKRLKELRKTESSDGVCVAVALRCVAVCCSVLKCVAVRCSVLRYCLRVWRCAAVHGGEDS